MVDLTLLQSVSYIVGALGVCIAAIFYVLNLRETTRNRRIALTTSLLQNFISEEGSRRWMELMQMEWKDFDDFYKKYDSSVNIDNYAKRNTVFNTMDVLGYQYRKGMIDSGTLWSICNDAIPLTWAKFKPLFDDGRKRGWYTTTAYKDFEYLAYEMAKIIRKTDPNFMGKSALFKSEYDEAFKSGKQAPPTP